MTQALFMKYFVLNPHKDDKYGEASRKAMMAYARVIGDENPEMAHQMIEWVRRCSEQIAIDRDG